MSEPAPIRVGLIGSGFMGRSHAIAMRTAQAVFGLERPLVPTVLADVDAATAKHAGAALAIDRTTGDWRSLVDDAEIDLIDITTPNTLHEPMAMAAIGAGKPVYCEKPLAPDAATACRMALAAEAAGVPTFVGFNYLKNPLVQTARAMVESGEIGEVWGFRGIHAEDYMTDPAAPWTWRLDPRGGAGAVADLGSHIISLARHVVGPITDLSADLSTKIRERTTAAGERRPVQVDDEARALIRFAGGATGTLEASWLATGRKMYLAFELTGSKGSILLNMERMNELRLFVRGGVAGREGYVEIPAGPAHPDYAPFCPAPGHQLGFNEIKAIEVKAIALALAGGAAFQPDFREAAMIQATVDTILRSARERRWVAVDEVLPKGFVAG
ncbi:MAG: Gfo/Idh/MocA family oxidoreductase [Geminicoccaceae bacterium]|jgi:predicted dehydrogenase|nr:Gfo/Idh/MocA family oxidoreductase [Geminicoccaceae bacterium]HRY26232.1 Gfo/Idh/MocA family oxidoreductase [Geminicoccaceae bacterium]